MGNYLPHDFDKLLASTNRRHPLAHQTHTPVSSRREFLKTSSVALAGAAVASLPTVHAAGSDVLKVGLIGCGGRGTGAATQALNAEANVKLVAMGDAFADKIESSLSTLRGEEGLGAKID